jgi:hypothetical protein
MLRPKKVTEDMVLGPFIRALDYDLGSFPVKPARIDLSAEYMEVM